MPWTVSHAAVVLPLRRVGPLPLNLPALVVGSMTPDVPYYLGLMSLGWQAHTLAGSVLVAWPLGLALLAVLASIRRPLCHLLPQPHRGPISARFDAPIRWQAGAVVGWLLSMLIGIWSHLFCDLFTHAPPAGTAWLQWLMTPVATVAGRPLLAHTALQVTTSAIGVGVLWAAYRRWLRARRADGCPAVDRVGVSTTAGPPGAVERVGAAGPVDRADGDRWRWALQAVLLGACSVVGVAYAASTAPAIDSPRDLEHQVFRALVTATAFYLSWLVAVALLSYARVRSVRTGSRRAPDVRAPDARAPFSPS